MTDLGVTRAGERGMILIIVLWSVALMTLIAVALTAYVRSNISATESDLRQLRSDFTLRSGVTAAAAAILTMAEDERQFLAGDRRVLDLGDGSKVEVTLYEATGRLDLNFANRAFLSGAFGSALGSEQEGAALADRVVELRTRLLPQVSEPDKVDAAGNAEIGTKAVRGSGEAATPAPPRSDIPKPPQNSPVFQTPLQLRALPGIGAETIDMVLNLVGVLSRNGRINPFSAPEKVLRAVPKLSDADLAVILGARTRHDRTSNAVVAAVNAYPDFMTLESSRAFTVRVRIANGPGLIVGSEAWANLLLTPGAAMPFHLLAMSW